ncbi:prephenate dehydrogenase [Micromonospora olivasterospora]|uniref:Prephenate dehydrogenase n=1 Tax=Micromonospora olivasterospora TaxID=1880 RepID=A0A562I5Z8_MICOL|nr:prephenate dehydrogenase/arogenate dehydrogenase family protein [Micromonospora olivasterospora]TWH66449.1 prephenate dehydrogenase [Micromonospora olivasterospora]
MVDSRALRAAVVGTGLIGGSVLLRLHEHGTDVTGWDPDDATRAEGRARGLRFPDELADAVRDRDVVFLCGPLSTLPEALRTVTRHTKPGCVVTDVGSTKGAVAAHAATYGLTDRFVPGHPMAGMERAGLGAAAPTLFDGAAWVLCPAAAGMAGFRTLAALIIDVFAARVVPMSPDVHDAVAALASHIPHLLAGSLAGAVAGTDLRDAVLGLAAGSFRDGTRVAGTPATRTADMLLNNREQVLAQLGRVTGFLDELAAALRADDAAALVAHYRRAQGLRLALLDRATRPAPRSFALGADVDDELEYLLSLGSSGGYLTACRVADGEVAYTGHLPPA